VPAFSGVTFDGEIELVEELDEEEVEELDLELDPTVEILKGKIDSIDYFGETVISFSHLMKSEFEYDGETIFDYTMIDESILDVYIEPA
jgi:S-adenosylmethionine hydrolase